jgi:hypothetical protein
MTVKQTDGRINTGLQKILKRKAVWKLGLLWAEYLLDTGAVID